MHEKTNSEPDLDYFNCYKDLCRKQHFFDNGDLNETLKRDRIERNKKCRHRRLFPID